MPLTGLVKHAGKVYELSKGTRKAIASIQEIEEKELPDRILALPKHPDIGTGLSQNLSDVLVLALNVFLDEEHPKRAKSEIDKLRKTQLEFLEPGGLKGYLVSVNPATTEYKNFINAANEYIDALVLERKQSLEKLKEQKLSAESIMLDMKNQLTGKAEELNEIKRQLAAKEDELQKSKEIKIDPKIAQKVKKYISFELKFQKSFTNLVTPDSEAKEVYELLHNVLSKCLNRRSDSQGEHKIDLPNAEFLAKITGLISKYSQSDKNAMNHKIFFTNAQSLIKELDLNKIPKDISMHDLEIYRFCATSAPTGMPFFLPWSSHAMRGLFGSQHPLMSTAFSTPAAEAQSGLEFDF